MRFLANGPAIPSDLIDQRQQGNVIFFCGAGISRPAGLPDFGGLTARLITTLNAEKAQRALDDRESFDRVFNALIREFGSHEIDRQIYLSLKTPRKPKLDQHRTILDLSRNLAGKPQIVTTNFDLLFECIDRKITRYVPPALPELALGQPIDGIVYLHGRLTKPDVRARSGYVISSGDFGRAYLAEGWAARFVRELRERFAIVLLGYSANDPPMRYLLEGLHAREGATYGSPLYAFVPGELGDVEEEWRDRGVTPLPYNPIDAEHSGLWDTLSAWATASLDEDAWNGRVLDLARRSPSTIQSFERGQVANLVSTKVGAKLFADADPPPPAEWLCVFDPTVRYAEPKGNVFENVETVVDPLDHYGLDDDPPRPEPAPNRQIQPLGQDFLSWRFGDASFPERARLGGWTPLWSNQLPERLEYLARWVGRVMGEPASIWWAAGWVALHPALLWHVKNRLERGEGLPAQALRFWQLYFEAQGNRPTDPHDFRWFEFEEVIKAEGWSSFALRQFERATKPYLEFSRVPYREPKPPEGDWTKLDLRQVVEMKVRVLDHHGSSNSIPAEALPSAVRVIRRSLEHAGQLLGEVGTQWWRTPTLHPSGEPGETFHGRKELYFLWFRALFDQLTAADPDAARMEAKRWDGDDPFFFGKLVIYALMNPAIATAREAASGLLSLDPDIFWDTYCQRELLFTLRSRWGEFSSRERRRIEKRVIAGPPRWNDEKLSEFRRRRSTYAALRLRWLELNGRQLTARTASALPALISADPRWTDEWARTADDSLGPRGGTIERVTELRGLDALPINQVIEAAEERSEDRISELKDFRPFEGLVASFPFRALSALRLESKQGLYPIRFWRNLLSDWPEGSTLRLRWLMAKTVASLPADTARELRHYVPRWMSQHLKSLADADRPRALAIFDAVVEPYSDADAAVTESGIRETSVGGVVQDRSEVSFSKAINSPCGKLTECLLSLQGTATKRRPLPKHIRVRLPKLFALPGNGGGHAVCIVAQRTGWFDHYYHAWVCTELIPLFSLEHPKSEAAWHGLAYDRNGLSVETWEALKPSFLSALSGTGGWQLDDTEQRAHIQRLVGLSRAMKGGVPLVPYESARAVLTKLSDKGRADAVSALSHFVGKEGSWRGFVKPFIEGAWPRQLRYRGEQSSRAFVTLLDGLGDDFPEGVKTVLPFLLPVPHLNMITYRLTKADTEGHDLVRRYPAATLSLLEVLVADDRSTMPYDLAKVLEIIAEALPTARNSTSWRRLKDLAG